MLFLVQVAVILRQPLELRVQSHIIINSRTNNLGPKIFFLNVKVGYGTLISNKTKSFEILVLRILKCLNY